MSQDALPIQYSLEIPAADLAYEYARASGAGGQHVNTTDTAVRLRFDMRQNTTLHPAVKARIRAAHAGDITKAGELLVTSQQSRSRAANVDDARAKLVAIVKAHLAPPKKRRATKPTKGSKKRRLQSKKRRGDLKKSRGRVRRSD